MTKQTLADTLTALRHWRPWLASLDVTLRGVAERERYLLAAIRYTHKQDARGGIVYTAAGCQARVPLFEELLELACMYGGTREEKRRVARQVKDLEKQADHLRRAEAYEQRKQWREHHGEKD